VTCWPTVDWWSQETAIHSWMAQARALAPSMHAPITLPVPTLSLNSSTVLRPGADPYEPRLAIWREDCVDLCLHILVANVNTHSPLSFTLELGGVWKTLAGVAAANATRLFDGQYTLPIVGGQFSDWVDAGATNVYEAGCYGPRPNSSTGWQACSSRRGRCTQGWTNKPGGLCGDDGAVKTDDVRNGTPRWNATEPDTLASSSSIGLKADDAEIRETFSHHSIPRLSRPHPRHLLSPVADSLSQVNAARLADFVPQS
jgi:hypothetical protein